MYLCNNMLYFSAIKLFDIQCFFYYLQIVHKNWNVGKVNHIAIAVPNMEKAASFYKDVLGAKVSSTEV